MDGWTVVRHGRRGRVDRQPRWDQGTGRSGGMDRARAPSFWRGTRHRLPNQPAPPLRTGWYPGPQTRSYAEAVRIRVQRRNPPRTEDPAIRREPASPQLGRLIRKLYGVIKRVHHLQNVAPGPDKTEPRMIARMVDILSTMIKPAFPTNQTADFIMGNAKNWGQMTYQILSDHYERGLEEQLEELRGSLPPDWKAAFEVAARWARNNLKRTSRAVIERAEAMVAALEASEQAAAPRDLGIARGGAPSQASQTARGVAVQTDAPPQIPTQSGAGRRPATRVDMATETDLELEWYHSTPKDREGLGDSGERPRSQRRPRGVVLTDQELLLEQQQVEEDQGVLRVPTPSDSLLQVIAELDELEEEERREAEARARRSRATSQTQATQTTSTGVTAQVHGAQDDDEENVIFDGTLERSLQDLFEDSLERVTRHPNTLNKNLHWRFQARKKYLILGDSNLSHIPDFPDRNVQVESFPGANFRHAEHVIVKAGTAQGLTVEKVVLSFGINCRANKPKETTVKNLQAAVRVTKSKFPYAEIYVPLLNFSGALPAQEKDNLRVLNEYIQRNQAFIPLLPEGDFETGDDLIHWTLDTARAMFNHWMTHLNLGSPRT